MLSVDYYLTQRCRCRKPLNGMLLEGENIFSVKVSVNVFGFVWFGFFVSLVFVWLGFVIFFLWYLSGDRIQDWRQFRLLFAY